MKQFTKLNTVLGLDALESVDESVSMNEEQLELVESALLQNDQAVTDAKTGAETERDAANASLVAAQTSLTNAVAAFDAIDAAVLAYVVNEVEVALRIERQPVRLRDPGCGAGDRPDRRDVTVCTRSEDGHRIGKEVCDEEITRAVERKSKRATQSRTTSRDRCGRCDVAVCVRCVCGDCGVAKTGNVRVAEAINGDVIWLRKAGRCADNRASRSGITGCVCRCHGKRSISEIGGIDVEGVVGGDDYRNRGAVGRKNICGACSNGGPGRPRRAIVGQRGGLIGTRN